MADYKPRAPRGMTHDPCPGCQGTERRAKESVCDACRQLLVEAKETREQNANRSGLAWFRVHIRASWNEYHYYVAHATSEGNKALQEAMTKLVAAVAEATYAHTDYNAAGNIVHRKFPFADAGPVITRTRKLTAGDRSSGWYQDHVLISPAAREAINELDKAILLAIGTAREEAARQSAGLLQRLATGDITLDTMNDSIAQHSAQKLRENLAEVEA